ncbi:MAG: OmpH family outer membrane protein [Methylophilaceae bacterium]
MNKLLRLLLIGSLSVVAGAAVAAPNDVKIGYVNVEQILKDAPQTAESGKKLEKEFSARQQELEKTAKMIKDHEISLDKDSLTMSETDRRNKERDVSNMKIELQRKSRELREDANLRKNEELGAIQERINKAVTAVAEAEGYDLVIYGGVAYASKKADITDKVLKSLGKK